MTTMMMCGHSANAMSKDGKPVCAICIGITAGADQPAVSPPDLTGRKARCGYYGSKCKSEVDSSLALAFFEHRPNATHDSYYCGCYGWD